MDQGKTAVAPRGDSTTGPRPARAAEPAQGVLAPSTPLLAWAGRTDAAQVRPLRMGGRDVAGVIGWGGLEVWDPALDLLELCAAYARAVGDLSCGQCVPCRDGSRELAALLDALRAGEAREGVLEKVRAIAETMEATSRCDVGRTSPRAVTAVLDRLEAAPPRPRSSGAAAPAFEFRSLVTAPCMQACPLHVDVPRYVELIGKGRFDDAIETICERLPLPGVLGRVCMKPCESACRRGLLDGPIQIKHLKRFVSDWRREHATAPAPQVRPATGARIAVVGAGPSGLTCASVLAAQGHRVTIFEKLPEPGGMLAVGIPAFRLPSRILAEEVEAIRRRGVEIVYGQALGRDFTLSTLRERGFRAVYVAVGTHKATRIDLAGDGAVPGVWDCLDLLRRAHAGERLALGDRVLVLGGGNVAIDVARTARRLGARDVRIVYRRRREQMRAHRWEVDEALEEGIVVEECWAPEEIRTRDGKLWGLAVRGSTVGQKAGAGLRSEDDRAFFEADSVVFAIGIGLDEAFQQGGPALEVSKGVIQADPSTFQTSVEGVFAGGDCVVGPDIVIRASAHGRMAGLEIGRYVETGEVRPLEEPGEQELLAQLLAAAPPERVALPRGRGTTPVAQEPPPERTADFREVEKGFRPEEASAEASRCLRCYRIVTVASRRP